MKTRYPFSTAKKQSSLPRAESSGSSSGSKPVSKPWLIPGKTASIPAGGSPNSRPWWRWILSALLVSAAIIFLILGAFGLLLQRQVSVLSTQLTAYLLLALQDDPQATPLLTQVLESAHRATPLLHLMRWGTSTWPASMILGPETAHRLADLSRVSDESLPLLPSALGLSSVPTTKRYILLFQNSEELRATGGFMGSYGLLELSQGRVSQLVIRDIYEPDGQFSGFIPAPPGVREYLSEGKGMRLPDTNWSPDVPSSVRDIIPFFAFGKTYAIDGVVFINLQSAQELLSLIGPVYLSDYGVSVTPENVAQLARADRETFFPGSQQKKYFLQALMTAVKVKVTQPLETTGETTTNLTSETRITPSKWWNFLTRQFRQKNIQFFAVDPALEQFFVNHRLAGSVVGCRTLDHCLSLYLVESNVGINKVNKLISRSVSIKQTNDNQAALEIRFTNFAPRLTANTVNPATLTTNEPASTESQDYINYQRLLLSPQWSVSSVQVGNEILQTVDQDLVTLPSGEQLKQLGFLVTVQAGSEQVVRLTLTAPEPLAALRHLLIQKQSGLPPTNYTTDLINQKKTFLLEEDEVF